MRWAPGLLALAACYGPQVASGVPCDPARPACPEGQSCVMYAGAFACEPQGTTAPNDADGVDVPLGFDRDGDGKPDDADNCPTVFNPGQENEDGDRFGDACDPCPPVADDNPPDADMDGVADACDPRPMTPGDRIALFEGFSNGIPSAWTQTGGTWMAAGGAVSIPAVNNQVAMLTITDPAAGGDEAVSAEVRFDDLSSTSTPRSVAVVSRADPALGGGIGCEVVLHSSGSDNLELLDVLSGQVFGMVAITPMMGDVVQLVEKHAASLFACDLISTMTQTVGGNPTFSPPNPQIGVRTHSFGATVFWIMVVASRPAA